ncbi:hypothetical protein FRC14_002147 [Serendipita sp. 396]|nr:hypothetical protein FRC14_002147 [Serendipita sp. 396]KAG8786422.1 hypothetical protein FRC15_011451 [Serendipita sp. 397]KAG8801774.1 hypothetical protein FRC16_011157 [Serendipita sp. 398]KAG8825092.1 hypothetical protein FRC19_000417 [Serendipita sp. 401]KAG8870451.1 hypothetical protein FRC20_011811 [Serendipita sp. 405]KAG9055892.1 hypothetical protein FS842_000847 [Serendipita sp. 407]
MSSANVEEAAAFFEKEKEKHMRMIVQTVDQILITLNGINRSQESTIELARDKVDGEEMNMWVHLRQLGITKAKEMAVELAMQQQQVSAAASQSQPQPGTDEAVKEDVQAEEEALHSSK